MSLAKHIILMLQIIACTTGFMNIYKDETNTKSKRSPADSFSLFGLSPRFTVPIVKQSLSTISQLFKPPIHQHKIEEQIHIPMKTSNVVYNNNPGSYDISTQASPTRNPYMKENTEKLSIDDLVQPNRIGEYIKYDNKVINGIKKQENNTSMHVVDDSETNKNQNITNNIFEEFKEIDKEMINSIFRMTTEDTTVDYTTDTVDYENSTTDELLRIPAAAVATLLGK